MADINLNPSDIRHDRVLPGVATETGIDYGDIVVWDTATTNDRRAVKRLASAGGGPIAGVVVSQTDPTNGSAIGDLLEICDLGVVEVNLVTTTAVVKGDVIINSATAGQAKVLAAEGTAWQLGVAHQDMASTAGVTRIAVILGIVKRAA